MQHYAKNSTQDTIKLLDPFECDGHIVHKNIQWCLSTKCLFKHVQ